MAGASGYQVDTQPSELLLAGSGGLSEEISGGTNGDPPPSLGTWTSLTLPTTPATWADQIVLHAADPADAALAQAAAAAAGLPASQVVTSFATAWSDTLSGEYLVLAVGSPAVAALYYNVCGWGNPSGLPAGSTPFYYYLGPLNSLPGADAYVNTAGATAADTQALATELASYAERYAARRRHGAARGRRPAVRVPRLAVVTATWPVMSTGRAELATAHHHAWPGTIAPVS